MEDDGGFDGDGDDNGDIEEVGVAADDGADDDGVVILLVGIVVDGELVVVVSLVLL